MTEFKRPVVKHSKEYLKYEDRTRLTIIVATNEAAKKLNIQCQEFLNAGIPLKTEGRLGKQANAVRDEDGVLFRLGDRINPIVNLVVSNVPGPRKPLYAAGAKLMHYYPVSTIVDGQGNRNRFDFENPRVNETIPVERFKFVPPPGTSVIKP